VGVKWAVGAFVILAATALPVAAQMTDWCGTPLPFQADPGTALVWRLRCTIQILDRERAEAEDHVTTAETDKALAEAHLKAVQADLEAANKKLEAAAPPAVLKEKKDK
jgi:hypothetical protein